MKILMFIMSLTILATNTYSLFQKSVSRQQIENTIWVINNWFDEQKAKKTIVITSGIMLAIKALYFLYATIMLQDLIYVLVATLIIVNLFDIFEGVIRFVNTYKIKLKQDTIPQYIFTILEIFMACNVILKVFQ